VSAVFHVSLLLLLFLCVVVGQHSLIAVNLSIGDLDFPVDCLDKYINIYDKGENKIAII
jgi:hypothetical protein